MTIEDPGAPRVDGRNGIGRARLALAVGAGAAQPTCRQPADCAPRPRPQALRGLWRRHQRGARRPDAQPDGQILEDQISKPYAEDEPADACMIPIQLEWLNEKVCELEACPVDLPEMFTGAFERVKYRGEGCVTVNALKEEIRSPSAAAAAPLEPDGAYEPAQPMF